MTGSRHWHGYVETRRPGASRIVTTRDERLSRPADAVLLRPRDVASWLQCWIRWHDEHRRAIVPPADYRALWDMHVLFASHGQSVYLDATTAEGQHGVFAEIVTGVGCVCGVAPPGIVVE